MACTPIIDFKHLGLSIWLYLKLYLILVCSHVKISIQVGKLIVYLKR